MATQKLARNRGQTDEKTAKSSEFPRWSFLTNHAHVLAVLFSEGQLALREVAQRVGITERAVQRIVCDLQAEGFVEIERVGRKNAYQINLSKHLRHPIEAHQRIGDLLELIGG